jgi:hypothetical protein
MDGEKENLDPLKAEEVMVDTLDLSEHMPDKLEPLDIIFKAKLVEDKVVAGQKKTVKIQVIVPYESERIRQVNDLLGEYVTLVIRRDQFKEPETELEKDALKQYYFEFGEEVGA